MSMPKWASATEETQKYYAEEWGKIPTRDDQAFEMLCLLTFQAGLTWATVLAKREELRSAFYDFNVSKVAKMDEDDIARLMRLDSPIKNERRIRAVINNAKSVMEYRSALPSERRGDALVEVLKTSAGIGSAWPLYGEEQLSLLRHFFSDWGFKFTAPKVIRALVESLGLALPWSTEEFAPRNS